MTRQHSAARREPLPAPPQESRPLLRTGQQDTEVRIRVSACSKGLRRNGLDQVPLDVLLEQRHTLESIKICWYIVLMQDLDDAHVDAAITRASTAPSLLARLRVPQVLRLLHPIPSAHRP